MIRLLFTSITVLFCSSVLAFDSRFGELTEMFDPKMRGQDNQWVRPHPGPFVWSMIEPKENDFFGRMRTNMSIMPKITIREFWQRFGLMQNGIKKLAIKKRNQEVLLENIFQNV